MATLLTIDTTPLAVNDTYAAVEWEVTSSDANIRAVRADIYIDGNYSSTINGVQLLGTSNEFSFDVRKILQSVLVSELRTNITTFALTDATTSAKTIKLRMFEIVESGGVFTSTWLPNGSGTNYLETSDVDVVNIALQYREALRDWTRDDNTKKLLTLTLDNKRIPRGVPFQVGFLGGENDMLAQIVTRDKDLTLISTLTATQLASMTSSKGIIEIPASIYASEDVAYIFLTLYFNDGFAFQQRSITYKYKIVDVCDTFTLFFQNHLGDFDHFDFGNKLVKKISTKNQRMTSPNLGVQSISSNVKTKIEVYTSSLTANELIFLEELIKNHTVVYRWESAGLFTSYVVTSHSTKVEDTDKLINLIKITLQPAIEHTVQNGD